MNKILLVVHPTRPAAAKFGNLLAEKFLAEKFEVFSNFPELIPGSTFIGSIDGISAAIVLGGDGTILRAAEMFADMTFQLSALILETLASLRR